MPKTPHPVWRRFGEALLRIRSEAKATQGKCAQACGVVPSMVSQIETGTKKPRREHAVSLDRELMTGGELTELWDNLFREEQSPSWFQDGLMLEREASEIRDFQTSIIPGLIQTREYAKAILASGHRWSPNTDGLEKQVDARMKRKEIIHAFNGPILSFVMGEEFLRRDVGSHQTMSEQVSHLIHLMEAGIVRFQIVTSQSPTYKGNSGSFRTMSFHNKPPVAIGEYVSGEQILRTETDVRSYNMLFSALQGDALSIPETIAELRKKIDQYEQVS